MAHQDYVSRPRSPRKKSNPYKKKNTKKNNLIPTKIKLFIAITLLAIIGFGYFLWVIKHRAPANEIVNPLPLTEPQPSIELPEPPQEKWQYIQELKSKQVEESQYNVVNKGPYKMQCGSFQTKKQAEVMRATIAFTGLSAQIGATKGSNGTWYKVYLGPYTKKRQAEKDKHKLSNNNISTCQIWGWN